MDRVVKKNNKLGLLSIVLLGINSIIGSGIYLLPNQAYASLGVSSILIIVAGAILVLSLALCYAEASAKINDSGSSYLYVKTAYGDYPGFVVAFFQWIAVTIGTAAAFAGLLTALQGVFPVLKDSIWYNITGVIIILLMFVITYFGLRASKIFNNISTVAKLVPMMIFIAVGLFFMKGANFTPFIPAVDDGIKYVGIFSSTFVVIFFAYVGFETVPIAASKMENAKRNVPIALLLVVLISAAIYFLITIACIGILGPELGKSTTPVADAIKVFWGQAGYDFVTLGTVISIIGVTFTGVFEAPILTASMSKRHYLPKLFEKENRFGSHGAAILLVLLLIIAFFLSGGFIWLVSLMTVAIFMQYVPVAISILKLRKMKELPQDGFRAPFGAFMPIFAASFAILLLVASIWGSWDTLLWGLVVPFIVGTLLFFLYAKPNIQRKTLTASIHEMEKELPKTIIPTTKEETSMKENVKAVVGAPKATDVNSDSAIENQPFGEVPILEDAEGTIIISEDD